MAAAPVSARESGTRPSSVQRAAGSARGRQLADDGRRNGSAGAGMRAPRVTDGSGHLGSTGLGELSVRDAGLTSGWVEWAVPPTASAS